MPRRTPNLQRRGNVFYLRVRVPDDLRNSINKSEIVKSLGTGDIDRANQAARIERIKLHDEWQALRRRLNPASVDRLTEQEIWSYVCKWFVATEKKNIERGDQWPSREDAERDLSDLLQSQNLSSVAHDEADRMLADEGLRLNKNSESWRRLERWLASAIVETHKRDMLRDFPNIQIQLDQQFQDLNARTILNPVAKKTLAELITSFKADPTRRPLQGKTLAKKEAHWRAIQEFFGPDTDVSTIDRAKIREFIALLQRTPSNASKHFSNPTIFEAADLAAQKSLPLLSVVTANGYLRTLGALFRFALNEKWIDADPSAGLLINGDRVAAKDKRLPFDSDDLVKIFQAPLYTGCIDDQNNYAKAGPNIIRRGRFWVPLIALFSGMRLNEICQLTLDDFAEEDRVDIVLIRGDEDGETKRVKTAAGNRFIPMHSELKKLGLLDYVEERRRASMATAVAFPDLPAGSTGYRSDPFSKYFARFLEHAGVKHKKKVFHSFRHTYRDALREAGISVEKVRALGGWTSGRTEDAYGSGFRASTLAKDIEAIRYPGLDLSALYVSQGRRRGR